MCITVIVGYAHNLCTDRRHDKLFILHLARAMHLAPCVPVRFVTGSIAAHLHPPRSSTIISSNRGRKSTPPPLSRIPSTDGKPSIVLKYSKDFDDKETLVCIPFLSSSISPRVRKMAELGTRCTIDRFRAERAQ